MSRRLPPLNGAARLRGRRPASQLHPRRRRAARHPDRDQPPDPGLEERLGVRLFRRLPRGLLLTEEAQRYLPPVRDAFDQIAAATERARSPRAPAAR